MAKNKGQRFYPLRDGVENYKHVNLTDVSEEFYRDIYPEIWREQKKKQKSGQCRCPAKKLWTCDAICEECEYRAYGNQVSLDAPLEDAPGLTVSDTIRARSRSPEAIVIDMLAMEALYEELELLDPEGRRMCELCMEGYSERKAAAEMKMARSTFKLHWDKVKTHLYRKLKDWQD